MNVSESVSIQVRNNDNLNMIHKMGCVYLKENGAYILITEEVKAVEPAKTYNVKFVWEIYDSNNLLTPSNLDVIITGVSDLHLVDSVTKDGTNGLQIYTAIIAIDTKNFIKGKNNKISITLTSKETYTKIHEHTLTQIFYVWDYETIDENNDYYIMYAANINPSITKIKNQDGEIVAYKLYSRSIEFSNISPVQVNYPTGEVLVEARPFEIIKYAVDSNDIVESIDSFKIEANVYADSNGNVDAEVILGEKTVTISYVDDYTLAQIVYLKMDDIFLNQPDKLTKEDCSPRSVENSIIKAAISSRVYEQGLHSSSPPSIGIVNVLEVNRPLDQIAHRNKKFGENNIMREGDLLVLSKTVPYERKVTDIHGIKHTLVAETPIKLILRQTAGAKTI